MSNSSDRDVCLSKQHLIALSLTHKNMYIHRHILTPGVILSQTICFHKLLIPAGAELWRTQWEFSGVYDLLLSSVWGRLSARSDQRDIRADTQALVYCLAKAELISIS